MMQDEWPGGRCRGNLRNGRRRRTRSIDRGAVCVAAGGAAANQAGRRAISAAWVIDGDTHCPVFLPRRRPVPASSWSSPSDTAKIACDLRLPSRRTFIFASLTPSIPSQV
uniref:Uncharacterized protein n=1 Tax=Oryza sativa subsp. indica TaxID=39946 RepID=A0A1V1H322_ORYSI|nr:hypothetical protein [Oryza sativa Indica Group]